MPNVYIPSQQNKGVDGSMCDMIVILARVTYLDTKEIDLCLLHGLSFSNVVSPMSCQNLGQRTYKLFAFLG